MELTDEQIQEHINEKKYLPEGVLSRFKIKGGHKEVDIDVIGSSGNKYRIIARQGLINELDFSLILAVKLTDGREFRLRRYNGKSHKHTNKIEKNVIMNGYHIHTATLRYQKLKGWEEDFAEETRRYSTIEKALECMILDCNFISEQYGDLQEALF